MPWLSHHHSTLGAGTSTSPEGAYVGGFILRYDTVRNILIQSGMPTTVALAG